MQTRRIYFYKIGGFSQNNKAISTELTERFPDYEFRIVDIEKDIINRAGSLLRFRAFTEVCTRYGWRMLTQKMPPRDFFPCLPCILYAIQEWITKNVHPSQTAFTFQTQSLFDARREGIPHFVYTDRTYLVNYRYEQPQPLLSVSRRWRQMERELYQKAALNFTFSQFAADSLIEDYGIPSSQVQCVYSGSNIGFPFSANTSRRTGQKILFIGVDWEQKGGPELLEAFSLVQKDIPDAELFIVGCEPEVFSPGITVVGRVPLEKIKFYYETADVFCLPSRVDASAHVLTEASAYALPVVATSVGENKERILEGETGFLVRPGNIDLLAKRLCRLLQEPHLRTEMGNKGRQYTKELFYWPRVADQIANAIKKKIYALELSAV